MLYAFNMNISVQNWPRVQSSSSISNASCQLLQGLTLGLQMRLNPLYCLQRIRIEGMANDAYNMRSMPWGDTRPGYYVSNPSHFSPKILRPYSHISQKSSQPPDFYAKIPSNHPSIFTFKSKSPRGLPTMPQTFNLEGRVPE